MRRKCQLDCVLRKYGILQSALLIHCHWISRDLTLDHSLLKKLSII